MEPDDNTPPDDGLGDLAEQAQAFEGAGQTEAAARAASAAADTVAATAAELCEALKVVRAMGAAPMAWWDQYMVVWSDKAMEAIAEAAAVVMQRHGWTMADAWSKLGPYIALIAATVPPSLVTWQAVKQRQAQIAAAQRRPAPAVVPAGASAMGPVSAEAATWAEVGLP